MQLKTETACSLTGICKYDSKKIDHAGEFMTSYYNSDFIKKVKKDKSFKMLSTFVVDEEDLEAGKEIKFDAFDIEDIDKITMATDDIKSTKNAEEIAKEIDPDGYKAELEKREPADAATTDKVKTAINGYYYSFFISPISYRIEFFAPDTFTIEANGLENQGTYKVLKEYVQLYYPSNNNTVNIPYSFNGEEIELDLTTAFNFY